MTPGYACSERSTWRESAPYTQRFVLVYWEIARRGYQRYATYPAATWAGLFTNIVFGFMRGSVLLGLYAHRVEVAGYDTSAVLTYTWLVQALYAASSL